MLPPGESLTLTTEQPRHEGYRRFNAPSQQKATKMNDTPQNEQPKPKHHKRKVSPRVLVRVTDEIIDTSIPKDSEHCMIADAVKAAFPAAKNISVDLVTVRFSDPAKGLRYIYLTPAIAQASLIDFDEGRRPQAFQCELVRAAQIVAMYKRKGTKATPINNLGRKRAQSESTGSVPTLIGGKPLPLMLDRPHEGSPVTMDNLQPSPAENLQPPPAENLQPPAKASARSERRKRGWRKRRREFGLRLHKSGADILISGTA